jgi:hypothetical protein
MHDVLRERLWRHIEALPEEQLYQALDYVEFLASKYARDAIRPPGSSLQRFGERLEDKMRGQRVGLRAIFGTLEAMGQADRVVSGLAEAGRSIWREVEDGLRSPPQRSGPETPRNGAERQPRALPPGDGAPGTPAPSDDRRDDPLTRI